MLIWGKEGTVMANCQVSNLAPLGFWKTSMFPVETLKMESPSLAHVNRSRKTRTS